jgi:alcohol dehydrogenase YqhD (iron-dependent ADH family)
MAHILERYFTNTPDVDVTDRLAEGLLLTVIRATKQALLKPDDYDARAQLMWAGTLAHNNTVGVGRVGDWASHQIEHELSGLYDVAHGAGLAVVFPAWMRYTLSHNPTRFAQLAARVWGASLDFDHPERTALEGIERFEAFLTGIGMPVTLTALGAKREDIPFLAKKTKRGPDGKTGNFVKLTRRTSKRFSGSPTAELSGSEKRRLVSLRFSIMKQADEGEGGWGVGSPACFPDGRPHRPLLRRSPGWGLL